MAEGVDYSSGRPGGAPLAAAGKKFAVRYLRTGSGGIASAEVADLQSHGLVIAVVYEGTAAGMRGGRAQGIVDASKAQGYLTGSTLNPELPIYFACDFDAESPSDLALIDAYLAGAASVIGGSRVGLYGGYTVIAHSQGAKSATWFWQTYAWSGTPTKWLPNTHIQQYKNGQVINGASVDLCRNMAADFGQNPVGSTPTSSRTDEELRLISYDLTARTGFIINTHGDVACVGIDFINQLSRDTGVPIETWSFFNDNWGALGFPDLGTVIKNPGVYFSPVTPTPAAIPITLSDADAEKLATDVAAKVPTAAENADAARAAIVK